MQEKLFEVKQIELRSSDGYSYQIIVDDDFLKIEYREGKTPYANHEMEIPSMHAEQIAQAILKLVE